MVLNEFIKQALSTLTLVGDVLIVLFLIAFIANKISPKIKLSKIKCFNFVQKNGILFAWIVAIISMSGSLFYSEVMMWDPCRLCWYQRIFMYPMVLYLGIAFFKKDFSIKKYLIPSAIIGGILGIYHYFLQMSENAASVASCVVAEGASCGIKYSLQYGYITIPIMALTAFVLIIIFLDNAKK